MGTRAAAFNVKLRNLQEYHMKITNNILPAPSGTDIAYTLKYFSQLLLGVLKDVPSIPIDVIKSSEKDHARISMFPSLDYKGLYYVVVQLLDDLPQVISGQQVLGQTILHTIGCMVPFLEHEYMDTLPYIVASCFASLPSSLHKDLLDMLCYYLLPFTILESSDTDNIGFSNISISSILMFVLNNAENLAYHSQLFETLMRMKRDLSKDLMCVIAHGTAKARGAAIELLFQYWPNLNPASLDRKSLSEKHTSWTSLPCQNDNCSSSLNNEAVKLCIDHTIALGSVNTTTPSLTAAVLPTLDRPPMLLLCIECVEKLYSNKSRDTLVDIMLPLDEIPYNCVNKTCKSSILQKVAVATCFSIECANYNCNKPVRYCAACHEEKHSGKTNHIVHTTYQSPWLMDSESQSYLVEAIVSLLKEAQPDKPIKDSERHSRIGFTTGEDGQETTLEERQLLSRYGVWLLVGLCTPDEHTPEDVLGRMLSMLCQWFHYTACLPDDQAGSALERLKGECIQGWLMKVIKTHFNVFVTCLLPHPNDHARLGGHWECFPSLTNQIKEGFKRLLCLVPYDIITEDVWGYIMPYWMECFRHDVSDDELTELKILLSKVLDPDLSPLGLTPKQMYQFISVRFENSTAPVQEQALYWLQILTMLEVTVPFNLLHTMFSTGVKSLTDPNPVTPSSVKKVFPNPIALAKKNEQSKLPNQVNSEEDQEINISCYILMLDILVKQFELQEISSHKGLETKEAKLVLTLILNILHAPWIGTHTCREFANQDANEVEQCLYCEMCAIWYQLALLLIEYFCPVMEVTMPDIPTDPSPKITPHKSPSEVTTTDAQDPNTNKVTQSTQQAESTTVSVTETKHEELPSKGISKNNGKNVLKIANEMQVTEEVTETVKLVPIESITPVVARSVTLTEDEVATNMCVVSPPLQTVNGLQKQSSRIDIENDFWKTSQGNFKFRIEDLSIQEQLVFKLLREIEVQDDADVLYHLLFIIKLMCLHSEVLNKAAKNHRGFLIWCQENLLIPNLWTLLQSEFSQISQLCVPLMLHCITLPSGTSMFWKVVEDDFKNDNWRSRFAAVERVSTIAHFLEPTSVKKSPSLQSSLANAFCYLVHCLDDIEASVAQRALLCFELIKTPSLKLLLWCLEIQFDLIMIDRPMILQTIFQLYNHLSDRRFLTWDFFLNRFDSLFMENQVSLERLGEISHTRDLKNSNVNSEMYLKKLSRAQEALTHTHISRSLSETFGAKLPYKRAMSAPIQGLIARASEKSYNRQSSAPAMTRKSSKLAAITGSNTNPTAIPEKFQQHFPNSFFQDSQMKEVAQEESHLLHVIHRVIEIEDHDRDTMHLLIFLFMQFLSRPDISHPQEEKALARNHQIVIRHLSILLGYSPAEKSFSIPPNKLRELPVFNAFITSMPKVLDFNFKMGNLLLPNFLPLLIYCPSPKNYVHDGNHLPLYSLWLLKAHVRQSWLMSVLIIMYKYSFNIPSLLKQIQMLLQIVMNTLEAQFHKCKPLHEHMMSPATSKSKDMAHMVDIEHIPEQSLQQVQEQNEREVHPPFKQTELSIESSELDDEEKELEAIPESPKSDTESQDKKELILPISSKKDAEKIATKEQVVFSKDDCVVLMEPQEQTKIVEKPLDQSFETEEEKQPLHPPVHRVIRDVSPKARPKMQRSGAVDVGSVKVKKVQEKESLPAKELQLEKQATIEHAPVARIVSADATTAVDDQQHQTVANKVHRTTSSDNAKEYGTSKQHGTASKSTWTIEVHSPVKLRPLAPSKPPQERLLPIGPTPKETRAQVQSLKDFVGDYHKGVQTIIHSSKPGDINFPSAERLLPIGPTPPFTRKELAGTSTPSAQKHYGLSRTASHPRDEKSEILKPKSKSTLQQSLDSAMSGMKKPSSEAASLEEDKVSIPKKVTKEPSEKEIKKERKQSDHEVKEKQQSPKQEQVNKLIETDQSKQIQSPKLKRKKSKEATHKSKDTTKDKPPVLEKTQFESLDQPASPSPVGLIEETPEVTQPSISSPTLTSVDETKTGRHYRRKGRKTGSSTAEMQQRLADSRSGVAAGVSRRAARTASSSGSVSSKKSTGQSIPEKIGNSQAEIMAEKCPNCACAFEEFSEEELGMCIVILGAYIHREPSLAAPIMPHIMKLVSKYASHTTFPWQSESNIHLPGNTGSIARQFLRCTLHQLSQNKIFHQIFNAHFTGPDFFKSMSLALADFVELNQVSPLVSLFEELSSLKHLPHTPELLHMLGNVATYLECITLETHSQSQQQPWNSFLQQLENFLRKFVILLPGAGVLNLTPLMRIMLSTLKLPLINTCKTILEPYSKVLSHAIQQSPILYEHLLELCNLCCRHFARERDRFLLTRTVVVELIQTIKFRTIIPDENLMTLVQFILQDVGGTLFPSVIVENLKMNNTPEIECFNTNASDLMKPFVCIDVMEFISDVHTMSRVKSNFLGTSIHLNEETLGGHLKAGISQYLSLEMTKTNGGDHRAVIKYLPWLYSLPSLQQGSKEFIDCVAHIRTLSWLLLGSLQHSALTHNSASFLCQPIPLEANTHIAEHIQVILAGFAEQSKASVLHMSSLFHAFILCQLWTMYCENISSQNPPGSDQYHQCLLILSDFWAKITPALLQLVCHSKSLAETVSLHFLSLMEALMECNSTMLARLLPLWTPVFHSYQGQLTGNTQVRLQHCINWLPPSQTRDDAAMTTSTLMKWLQRMQTRMCQIEMQSSAAIQFYSI